MFFKFLNAFCLASFISQVQFSMSAPVVKSDVSQILSSHPTSSPPSMIGSHKLSSIHHKIFSRTRRTPSSPNLIESHGLKSRFQENDSKKDSLSLEIDSDKSKTFNKDKSLTLLSQFQNAIHYKFPPYIPSQPSLSNGCHLLSLKVSDSQVRKTLKLDSVLVEFFPPSLPSPLPMDYNSIYSSPKSRTFPPIIALFIPGNPGGFGFYSDFVQVLSSHLEKIGVDLFSCKTFRPLQQLFFTPFHLM